MRIYHAMPTLSNVDPTKQHIHIHTTRIIYYHPYGVRIVSRLMYMCEMREKGSRNYNYNLFLKLVHCVDVEPCAGVCLSIYIPFQFNKVDSLCLNQIIKLCDGDGDGLHGCCGLRLNLHNA